ncbi:MAG: hypothetical protein Q9160_009215 [Pyrenula sp. 1 TL-2023]
MSGIEIAGLVLAVLPLFISAAEHYRDGLGLLKRLIRRKEFIMQYKDELVLQRTFMSLYIKAAVGRTALPPLTQLELVDNPDGTCWQTPAVVSELKKSLGDAHIPFVNLISRVCALLVKHIKLDDPKGPTAGADVVQQLRALRLDDTKPTSSTGPERKELWERLKFSWKHSERTSLLMDFRNCNADLEKLNKAMDGARPYERKQQSRRAHETFKLREATEQLYRTMCTACSCQPSKSRNMSLALQVHAYHSSDRSDPCFHMLWFDANHKAYALSARIAKGRMEAPPRKRIRFDDTFNAADGSDYRKMKRLVDICKAQTLAEENNVHLQLLIHENGDIYAPQESSRMATSFEGDQLLSLYDLMSTLQVYDRKTWLHREKAILAVVLSYSLLQLHESSWLQSYWDSGNITFIDSALEGLKAAQSPDRRIKLRRPYTQSIAPSPTDCPSSQTNKRSTRRNAHIHALGVVLMELYLNRSIETDVATRGGCDYRGVAQDLLEEHSDDFAMKPEFSCAIRFCLAPHPNPYTGSFSFQDAAFRDIFYTEVISRLEDNLTANFGISESFWLNE